MKITSTSISSLFKSQVKVIERDDSYFKSPFHFHPEFELVYIVEGYGKRIVGSKIEEFKKGEMLLIGPNIPHVWISDKSFYEKTSEKRSKAIVVYFNPKIFSEFFYQMDEAVNLNKLFVRAEQGIIITGSTRKETAIKLQKIITSKGLEKVICLLDILNNISKSHDYKLIFEGIPVIKQQQSERLTHLFEFINTNFKRSISLKEVSGMLSLTPGSFCRYFRQKTGKTFIDYLQETRISNACNYLLNTDLTVSEVAYKTGFKTASYFNKLFKKYTNSSPTEYRNAVTNTLT